MGRHDGQGKRRDERGGGTVRNDPGPDVLGHRQAPDLQVVHDDAPVDEEPEHYGLRITWQSEEERLEAAEFLVATRVQQDAKERASRDIEQLRHHDG
jgi:hypothetical protein